MIIQDSDRDFFYSQLIHDEKYLAGFGSKFAGNAKDRQAVENFFNHNQIPFRKVVIPSQIHGTDIHIISETSADTEIIKSDGLITNLNDVALIIKTADCVPIVFVDKNSGLIGISHQGWKGTLEGMSVKMIETMVNIGASKHNIQVAIGPCVGGCCYSVSHERAQKFRNAYPAENGYVREWGNALYLHLLEANYKQIIRSGIQKEKIDYRIQCTHCQEDTFFSYRREGKGVHHMVSFVIKRM